MEKTIELEKFQLGLFMALSDEMIGEYCNKVKVSVHTDILRPHMIIARALIDVAGYMLEEKEVKYPATWWDAFKKEVLPYKWHSWMNINYITKTLRARKCFPELLPGTKSIIYYAVE